jgi:hypothetical protein
MNAVAFARDHIGLAELAVKHSRMNGRVPRGLIEAGIVAERQNLGVPEQCSILEAVDAQAVNPACEHFALSIAIYVGRLNGGVIHRLFPPQPITELRKCDLLRPWEETGLLSFSKSQAGQQNEGEREARRPALFHSKREEESN